MPDILSVFQPAPFTVADVCAVYLRHCEVEGAHCPEARADRQRTLGLFCDQHGTLAVADAKPFHLSDWIEQNTRWRSVATRRAKANMIRAAFQWAADGERIGRNPFANVRYAEAEREPELPDDVFAAVVQLANKHFERAVRFLRLTGARLSEVCRAQWPDVDLDRGIWVIDHHKTRRTTGRAKIVAIVAEAVELLREIAALAAVPKNGQPTLFPAALSGHIFLNTRGRPWNRHSLGAGMRTIKKRHGIQTKATLHGMRHRMASAAIAAGAPIKLVAAQLGHASVSTTERYYCSLEGQIEAIRGAAQLGVPRK